MEKTEILERLYVIVEQVFGVNKVTLKSDAPFKELPSWDSFGFMDFLSRAEDEFKIKFSFNDVISIATLEDAANCIEEQVK